MLPYDISVQATGRYRSRQVITQGYRKANFSMNFGIRKTFLNRKLTLALNCRDILNSRKFENFTRLGNVHTPPEKLGKRTHAQHDPDLQASAT